MIDLKLMDLEEIAQQLNIHIETLRRAIRAGKLEAMQIGRKYKVSQEAIEQYLENQKVKVVK